MTKDSTINTYTEEQAGKLICPQTIGRAPTGILPMCAGAHCMAWRWADASGFEEKIETTLDWRATFWDRDDEGPDYDGFEMWLTIQVGEERAKDLLRGLREGAPESYVDDETGEEFEVDLYDWEEEQLSDIISDLDEVLNAKKDGFVATKVPEGDHWGLVSARVYDGQISAKYQRPASNRGYCGMAGAVRTQRGDY